MSKYKKELAECGYEGGKILNTLFVIVSMGLAVLAVIFISVSIFSDTQSEWILPSGLFCCALIFKRESYDMFSDC